MWGGSPLGQQEDKAFIGKLRCGLPGTSCELHSPPGARLPHTTSERLCLWVREAGLSLSSCLCSFKEFLGPSLPTPLPSSSRSFPRGPISCSP